MKRFFLLTAALVLVACSSDSDNQPTPSAPAASSAAAPSAVASPATATAPASAADLLARIDSETALVWLSLEPLPEPLLEQLWGQLANISDLQRAAYDDMAEQAEQPLVSALLAELGQLDSIEAYAERGINVNGVAGIHLAGIFPMLHWELSDADAFAATLARIETDSETPIPRREIDGQEIIWVDMDGLGLAIHHDASFMTAALVADREDLLRRVANLDQASNPMTASEVNAFTRARGYLQDSTGFIDFQRMLAQLLDSDEELLVQARSEGPLAQLAQEPACRSELEALTTLFPRKSFGTTELSASSMSVKFLIETEAALGGRLSAVADSPVSLAAERANVLSMGLAFNLIAARDFARDVVGGWVDSPPQCSWFNNIAENASSWQLALNRPIPPLVTNLQGARLRLDSLQLGEGSAPDGAGTLAVFMRNPQMMIGMAQMFSPELAALDLSPGSGPQALPAGLLPDMDHLQAWLGLSETGLGLAVGEGQDAALPAALVAGSADSAILTIGMDMQAYADLLEAGLANLPTQDMDGADIDVDEATEVFRMMAGLYRYAEQAVHLTGSGIDIRVRVDLAD